MNFAATWGRHSGRATPSLRNDPMWHITKPTGRRSTYRWRNAVSTRPSTSEHTVESGLDAAAGWKTIERPGGEVEWPIDRHDDIHGGIKIFEKRALPPAIEGEFCR